MPRYIVTVGMEVDIIASNPYEAQELAIDHAREESGYLEMLSVRPFKKEN